MRIIVTAGPTREYLDDVRFLSNASSGRMGYAIARAALRAGHVVHLVSGPTSLRPPLGVNLVRVESTSDMYEAVARLFSEADCLIGAAAPADYTPYRRARGKRRKTGAVLTLRLRPTVDILSTLGRRKGRRVVIAFALEVQRPRERALEKMRRKRADAVVLNAPGAMGAKRSDATIMTPDGRNIEMRNAPKERIAARIVRLAESLWRAANVEEGKREGR